MLSRRNVMLGGPVLVASAILAPTNAEAGLGGIFKKVVTTAVQGATFITNPAQQVAAATKVLAPLVNQVSPDAGRAVEMVNKIASNSSTLEGRLSIIAGLGVTQGLPLFVNTGYTQEDVPTYAEQSARPMFFSSSDEAELRADPTAYVAKNAELIADQVKTFPYAVIGKSYLVDAGGVLLDRIEGQAPKGAGLYPSVLSIGNLLRLVSIFRGV
ncbi:hypothetical protein ACWAT4_37000 [Bradyrhizobium manausense]